MLQYRSNVFFNLIIRLLPIVTIVFFIVILVFEWAHFNQEKTQLRVKLDKLTATYSMIFSEPVKHQDRDVMDLFLAAILSEPDVSFVEIKALPEEEVLIEYGGGDRDQTKLISTQKITFVEHSQIDEIGQITIGFSTRNLRHHFISNMRHNAITYLILVLTLLLSLRLAYHWSIGRYLDRLLESISRFRATGKHVDINVEQEDELGQVIATYNQMQQQQVETRLRLLQYQETLEDQVEARSRDLVEELDRHRHTAEQLFQEKERVQVVLASIQDAVISTDNEGRIRYLNQAAESLLEGIDVVGASLMNLLSLSDKQIEFEHFLSRCLANLEEQNFTVQDELNLADDKTIQAEITVSSLTDTEDHTAGVVVVIHDVTIAKAQHEQLRFQASHDSLTKLLNRRAFEIRLEQALENALTDDAVHSLCFLDLDQFKVVNDVAGHVAGDELLVQLSHVLEQHVWKRDVLARIGGDEFAILMEHCDVEHAREKAEQIRQLIEDFRFAWEQQIFSIGVSIGLVQINRSSGNTTSILQKADVACYAAKDRGRNRIHIYKEHDEVLARHEGDMYWASRVQAAIDADQFMLYGQRIASVDGHNSMFEVLVRMKGEDGETIPPGAFLPAAERYNLSHRLDRWVFQHTVDWLETHYSALSHLDYLSINLSGAALGEPALRLYIHQRLAASTHLARKITFEITETQAVANLREASDFIHELKALGCRFALDDFGSGLSSFAYLKNLPVDILKIDGVFVKDILDDPIDAAMVRSIIDIGHVMNMKTVAEFVESRAILDYLKEMGADYVQGYGVAQPQPIDGFLDNKH
jgi:diguanylate cyclase (GGDEF)-like protein/PAS domain S-box-containing protein